MALPAGALPAGALPDGALPGSQYGPVDSPAAIFAKALLDQELFTLPSNLQDWPVYRYAFPDGTSVKPQLAVVFDTTGILHGKIRGGIVVQHLGVQLRIRVDSKGYAAGYEKAYEVQETLSPLSNVNVDTAGGSSYVIRSFVQTTPIVNMGPDEERRHHFSLNYVMSIEKV